MSDNDEKTPEDNVVRVAFGGPPKQAAPADPAAAEKLEIFSRLIEAGMVLVNLDARTPGAALPPQFVGDAQLGLNFSHRFGIPDFAYDERGVRATLSFQGNGFFCDVPWSAVFMLRSYATGEVVLFPGSLPPEIAPLLEGIDPHLTAARPADEEDDADDTRADEDRTQRERPRMVGRALDEPRRAPPGGAEAGEGDEATHPGSKARDDRPPDERAAEDRAAEDRGAEDRAPEARRPDDEPPDDEPPGGGRRPPGLRLVKS